MNTSTYTLWSMWQSLSTLNRLFLLILAAVCIYSIISAAIVVVRLRYLRKDDALDSILQNAAVLSGRCQSLRQILSATFYLFGLLLFLTLQNATNTLGDGRGILSFEILNNFVFDFAYAANVFFVFLVLHSIQWTVSSRVQAYTVRLGHLPQR